MSASMLRTHLFVFARLTFISDILVNLVRSKEKKICGYDSQFWSCNLRIDYYQLMAAFNLKPIFSLKVDSHANYHGKHDTPYQGVAVIPV